MMISNNLPSEIENNIILKYLTIYDNKYINKAIENERTKKIQISIVKINKLLCKYMLKRKHDIDYAENEYYIQKKFWKLYYPLIHRKQFLKKTILVLKQYLKNLNNINKDRYSFIISIYQQYVECELTRSHKNMLVITFNKIIELLTDNELFHIGW